MNPSRQRMRIVYVGTCLLHRRIDIKRFVDGTWEYRVVAEVPSIGVAQSGGSSALMQFAALHQALRDVGSLQGPALSR